MPQEIVCKFRFVSVKQFENYDHTLNFNLEFVPVSGDTEENKKFWKYTPSGKFEFTTINEEAAKMFQFGHEYYVTFKEANTPEKV